MEKRKTTYIHSIDSEWTTGNQWVDIDHDEYLSEVRFQAEQCFSRLDSAMFDFKDQFGKLDRHCYVESCKNNLLELEGEIEVLKELIDDHEKLDAIDSQLVLEKLKEPA